MPHAVTPPPQTVEQSAKLPSPQFIQENFGLNLTIFRQSQTIENDKINDKINGKINGKIKFSKRLMLMCLTLKRFPSISIPELSIKLGVSKRTISRDLKTLQNENAIKREASKKSGCWVVMLKT